MTSRRSNRLFWSDYAPQQRTRKAKRPRRRAFVKTIAMALAALVLGSVSLVLALRWIDPPTSAFMLRYRWRTAAPRHAWVDWPKISPNLPIAVVAAEDQKFPEHWGFDFEAIAEAIETNTERHIPRGASTISQQVAKNLFLWPGRSMIRKGIEAYLTLLIEYLWPKQRILEVYLNMAEFGPGIFGADAASWRYFKKKPSKLTAREAALLAAVLPNPSALHVDRPSAYVLKRVAHIQRQVRLLGGPPYLRKL